MAATGFRGCPQALLARSVPPRPAPSRSGQGAGRVAETRVPAPVRPVKRSATPAEVAADPAFREALTWLEMHGDTPEVLEHWRGFIEAADTGAPHTDAADAPPSRRRRRRRRRRGPFKTPTT